MLDAIWNWVLDLTALLVTPDWGALIALIPVAIMVIVVVWIIWIARKFRAQPPARLSTPGYWPDRRGGGW